MLRKITCALGVASFIVLSSTSFLSNAGTKIVSRSEYTIAATTSVKYDANLESHIIYRDTAVPRSKGIGGAHNLDEFKKIIAIKGSADEIKVISIDKHPTKKDFFYKYTYQIRALDTLGKPTTPPADP